LDVPCGYLSNVAPNGYKEQSQAIDSIGYISELIPDGLCVIYVVFQFGEEVEILDSDLVLIKFELIDLMGGHHHY
jgi:hypothetical protein